MTPIADRAVRPQNEQAPPAGTPVVGPGGGASDKIKYVFYITRENRTYDQIFGSEPRGDGDAQLELFDDNGVPGATGGVTPNAHALARKFPLLDHLYADSEVSIDGHTVTGGGFVTDYMQKSVAHSYADRGRSYDFGLYPVSFPPNHFLFDQAARHGVSFRDYGEADNGNVPGIGDDGRPTYQTVLANTDQAYPTNTFIGCTGPGGGLTPNCVRDAGQLGSTTSLGTGQSRFNQFRGEFEAQLASGTVPHFNYILTMNDHTNGTTQGAPTPKALVAENDLAIGQIVDEISHSSIWGQSAIFIQEDDSQDGADHVDAHRMPAFVISPWTKQGAVVPTRYDQYSIVRTAALILGLPGLSLADGLAVPMYDAFRNDGQVDVEGTRYTAIQPQQSFQQTNGVGAPNARLSGALPYGSVDAVPQAISDRILWQSVHGANSTPPPPGPGASVEEHDRAVQALRLYRRGGNVRRYLREHTHGDG